MAAQVGEAGGDVGPYVLVTTLATPNRPLATTIHDMKRLLLALTLLVAASAHAKLDFIENDYKAAMALAKTKNVPVFVEAWAPW